jgi:putative ABC transport system permease protein
MLRQKGFSIINIAGLTIGITCSLLIILYIYDELSFDKFHPHAERTYRVGFKGVLEGKKFNSAQTGTLVAEGLQGEIAEIESTMRMASWRTFPVRYKDKAFTEPKLLLVDENFFKFFNFKLVEGNVDSVLRGERSLVLTESAAKRYFNYKGKGDRSPIGEIFSLAQGYTAKVTGIAEDPPLNSHFHFTILLSLRSYTDTNPGDWMTGAVYTYFKIKPDATIENVSSKFNSIIEKKVSEEREHIDLGNFKLKGNSLTFFAQPLLDIHLKSQFNEELEPTMNVEYLYTFGCIALFIVLLACINFMNLSTARSASRAKEVGIRKAIGAPYNRLMAQFLFESYLYIFIAIVLSILFIVALLPVFNFFTHKQISFSILIHPVFLIGSFLCMLFVGLLAGSYPAFYLSHFSPIEVLKGRLREQLRSYGIRNGMVIFQFFISSVLIISTLVLYLQIKYIQKANIGFDKQNIIRL